MIANRRETALRADILHDLTSQGFYATGTNDRFIAGKPDFRMGRKDLGQLDVELKIIDAVNGVVQTGLTALQKITIREMNEHGMPAVALTYVENRRIFVIHHEREIDLDSDDMYVIHRSSSPGVIDGKKLIEMSLFYLEEMGLG